ncbi:HAD family phosphatase [Candidatus Uhrbacteria bacterium]|nr:HAD family phosphatase [Candidatus Uhrbacteria bacterium]
MMKNRIEQSSKKSLAVFDIDGTIYRNSLMTQLHLALTRQGVFPPAASASVGKEYLSWLNRKGPYIDYVMEIVRTYDKYIKGVKQRVITETAKKLMAEQRHRVYVYSRNLIRKLRASHILIAISGSPIEVVKEFNRYWKFDHVFGRVMEVDGRGRYTGRTVTDPVLGKREMLQAFVDAHHVSLNNSIAVGDTESDIPMLSAVEHPICFNPNRPLYEEAKKKKWDIVVERKDVIYEL